MFANGKPRPRQWIVSVPATLIFHRQTHLLEGNKLIENVILDVQDVLRLSNVSRVVFLPLLAEGCAADGTGRV